MASHPYQAADAPSEVEREFLFRWLHTVLCPLLCRRPDSLLSVCLLERWVGQAVDHFLCQEVTDNSGTNYIEPLHHIATFDQDGALWVEHPLYTQGMFALARVHDLAAEHPEWRLREPLKVVLANDGESEV